MNASDLNKKPIAELRNILSSAGIPHTSKMRKADLVNIILQAYGTTPSSTDTCQTKSDELGKEIFDTFVKKYQKDMIFQRERNKIYEFYKNKKLLSDSDYIDLLANVDGFETSYNNFIKGVDNDREFKEKSSTSKIPRTINTGTDWAEAIIELQDNVNKFKLIIPDVIKSKTNIDYLTTLCDKQGYQKCAYPCTKRTSKLKNTCSYKK
jgi:hypothetical protein